VQATLDAVRAAMREHNVYRGRTISLHAHEDRSPAAGDVTAALDDLLADRSALTRRLLGQPGEDDGEGFEPRHEMLRAVEASGCPCRPASWA
jgi:hypothetical protein